MGNQERLDRDRSYVGNQERLDKDRSYENSVVNMNVGNQEMLAIHKQKA